MLTPSDHRKLLFFSNLKPTNDPLDQNLFNFYKGNGEQTVDFFRWLKTYSLPQNLTPLSHIQLLRKLFSLLLILKDYAHNDFTLDCLNSFSSQILKHHYWHEFQLIHLYICLCQHLLNERDTMSINLIQNENGSVILEYEGRTSWAGIVHQNFLTELGVVLTIYGKLTNDSSLFQNACKICEWQTNLLDYHGIPLHGLFSQEKHTSILDSIAWNYLLFQSVGNYLEKLQFLSIADKQFQYLQKECHFFNVPIYYAIIEEFIQGDEDPLDLKPVSLNRLIYDLDHALVGIRKKSLTSVSTTLGGKTGLGTYMMSPDFGVVTYGPQRLPFGDCDAFGVEASQIHQKKFKSSVIQIIDNGYEIKGWAKLPGKEILYSDYATFGNSSHSELWVDIAQKFYNNKLDIEINLLGFDLFKDLSFVFYIRAESCKINNEIIIKPKTLEKYSGKIAKVECLSKGQSFTIESQFFQGTLEVIPLAGDSSFWGGDFLVGFSLSEEVSKYQWSLCL